MYDRANATPTNFSGRIWAGRIDPLAGAHDRCRVAAGLGGGARGCVVGRVCRSFDGAWIGAAGDSHKCGRDEPGGDSQDPARDHHHAGEPFV
jgi:hypothetical protein